MDNVVFAFLFWITRANFTVTRQTYISRHVERGPNRFRRLRNNKRNGRQLFSCVFSAWIIQSYITCVLFLDLDINVFILLFFNQQAHEAEAE